ncbi:MAG: hypothetical protein K8R35_08005 [Bacteroidales bacterium]|nr:hypothetical protein [Bacteroidales bacterium]
MTKNSKIEDKNPFKIPGNYFGDMTDSVLKKAGAPSQVKKVSFITVAKPILILAAAMIGFALISYLAIEFLIPGSETDSFEINCAELTEYLSSEIDEAFIIEEIVKADITDELIIPAQDIIDYLIDTNIDYAEILENL